MDWGRVSVDLRRRGVATAHFSHFFVFVVLVGADSIERFRGLLVLAVVGEAEDCGDRFT